MKRFTLSLCLIATVVLGAGISVTKPFSNKDFSWLLKDATADTIEESQNGMGWADDMMTFQTPVGAMQFGESGSPLESRIYWPGVFEVGKLQSTEILGSITGQQVASGAIPIGVMQQSMTQPAANWQDSPAIAGANGLTYTNTGPLSAPEPPLGTYFAVIETQDGGDVATNSLAGKIKTHAQMGVPNLVTAPASASATGTAGQVAYDTSYFYVCTATNTWKRVAIATW